MAQRNVIGASSAVRPGERVGWAVYVVIALAAILYLPQFFPVKPAISDSFLFGYNNRVAVLLLLFFLGVGATFSKRLGLHFQAPAVSPGISRRAVWRWMAIFAAGWAIMCFFTHGLGGFGESTYLTDRVHMLAAGKIPYRDFEFIYGAGLLYGPRLFMFLHLSVEQAYLLFWLCNLLCGVWLLARTLDLLDYPSDRKAEIFTLMCCFALLSVLSMGLNFTLFRFLPLI